MSELEYLRALHYRDVRGETLFSEEKIRLLQFRNEIEERETKQRHNATICPETRNIRLCEKIVGISVVSEGDFVEVAATSVVGIS